MVNPTTYTEELANLIVDGFWEGKTLRQMREENPTIPCKQTLHNWRKANPEFGKRCDEAIEGGAYELLDETLEIADDARNDFIEKHTQRGTFVALNEEAVQRSKMRIWARHELIKRKCPKVFGDRHVIAGDPEAPLQNFTEQQLDDAINALLAKAEAAK